MGHFKANEIIINVLLEVKMLRINTHFLNKDIKNIKTFILK